MPPSNSQVNEADSFALNVNVADGELTVPLGPPVMVTFRFELACAGPVPVITENAARVARRTGLATGAGSQHGPHRAS